eukprot:SAG22_NODE_162_length_16848_cov_16.978267_18_plen_414_part_00
MPPAADSVLRRLRGLTVATGPPPALAPLDPLAALASVAAAGDAASSGDADGATVALISHLGGAHVELYMDGLAAAENVGRVVLADPDGVWESIAKEKLGAKLAAVFADPHELLRAETPVMSLISMEARVSPPVIRAALEAGSHVMAEKPSCVHARDFRPLVELGDRKGLHLMLALSSRILADVCKAKELVASGAIGEVYGVEMHSLADQTRLARDSYAERVGWTLEKQRSGGGHLVWLGIHYLDAIMFIVGSSIAQVSGMTHNVGEYGKRHDVEDSTVAAVRFDNGCLGTITSGFYTDQGYNSHIKVWGSKGWLRLEKDSPDADEDFPLTWYSHDAGDPNNSDPDTPAVERFGVDVDDPLAGGYTPWVIACVDACLGKVPPPISNSDSLRVLEVVHAIYDSEAAAPALAVPPA